MPRSKHVIVAVTLLGAGLACTLPGAGEVGNVATSVAATLTAVVSGGTIAGPEIVPGGSVTPEPPTPAVAPPFLRIVYIDGGNVMLIEEGAPPLPLTASGDAETVRIASDGMKIVYTRRLAPGSAVEMHSLNMDGTGDLAILTPAALTGLYPLPSGTVAIDVSSFAWIPGTHTVAFNTLAIPEFIGLFKFDDLLTVDADTGAISTLLAPGLGGDFSISPDGAQIAFAQPEVISLINSDGSNLRPALVTYDPVITYSEYQYYAVPVWDTLSTAAGIAIPSADPLGPVTSGGIWRIPADGSPAVHLTDISGDFFFSQFEGSSLSPHLTDVGFLRDTANPNISDLILANSDGNAETPYVTGSIQWLGWAPFSSQFTFSFGSPTDIRLGTLGGGPVPLATGMDLRWINATEFLYLGGSFGSWTLSRGEIGAAAVPLASPAGDFVSFDFDT
jgi:hypothetical protein